MAASVYAISAAPAAACVIGGFSVIDPGGVVRPGDWVSYTMYAVPSDESPGDSAYTISVNSVPVATGFAAPSKTGRWEEPNGRFQVPSLGKFAGDLTVTVQVESGVGPASNPVLHYDGTPAVSAPAAESPGQSAPAAADSPGSPSAETVVTPAPADIDVAEKAVPGRASVPSARAPERTRAIARIAPERRTATRSGGAARGAGAPLAGRVVAERDDAAESRVPVAVHRREPSRSGRRSVVSRRTQVLVADVAPAATAARAGLIDAAAGEPPLRASGIALALILLVAATGGAADIYAATGGRRGGPDDRQHADEIEAELQAMIEAQLAAQATRREPRALTPV